VTAISVPDVSKKSTNKNAKTANQPAGVTIMSSAPPNAANNVGSNEGNPPWKSGSAGIPAAPSKPAIKPTTAVITKPKNTAALTLSANKIIVTTIPNNASKATGFVKSPKPVGVPPPATIIPTLIRPIYAIKKPIPAPIANLRDCGIAATTFALSPVTLMIRYKIPETKTAPNACCHE
jgi:hypothetical protein